MPRRRSFVLFAILTATSALACSGADAPSDDSRESDQALTQTELVGSALSCAYGDPWTETKTEYTQYLFFGGPDHGHHVLRKRGADQVDILEFSTPYEGGIDIAGAGHFKPIPTPHWDGRPGYTRTVYVPGVDAFGKNATRGAYDDCSLWTLPEPQFAGNEDERALLGKKLHCTYNEAGLGQGRLDAELFAGPDQKPWAKTAVRLSDADGVGSAPYFMSSRFAGWQNGWLPFSVVVATDPDPTINKDPMLKLGEETFDVKLPTHPAWLDSVKPPRSFELRCSID